MRHVCCRGGRRPREEREDIVRRFPTVIAANQVAMALWSYFGDRRSFRGSVSGNHHVGRRLVNGVPHRGRTISETLDVLEDVEEEIPSPETSDTGASGSPTTSVNEVSLPSSYQSDQGSVRSGSGALFRRWLGRTRSVDESVISSSPDQGELIPEPISVRYVGHPVTDIFPSRHRVRHSSAPFPSRPDPPRRDPRFIDKNLIDVKRIENGAAYKNGIHDEPDVWVPRVGAVGRKVYPLSTSNENVLSR